MSYTTIENRIKSNILPCSVRFLELVAAQKMIARRQLENEGIRRPFLAPFPYHTPELDSLALVDSELARENPRTAFLYLLSRLNAYDRTMRTALNFLARCFRKEDEDIDIIRREIEGILFPRNREGFLLDMNVYLDISKIYLGDDPGLSGFIIDNNWISQYRKIFVRSNRYYNGANREQLITIANRKINQWRRRGKIDLAEELHVYIDNLD
jgi:hypothetical protein